MRLVTLTGPSGAGKTRLALQTAAEFVDEREHGATFVSLAATSDPMLVASEIAEAMGMRGSGRRSLVGDLREALCQRDLLLVLDNFEHLLTAGPLVADLIGGAPRLTVLVASRTPLGLPSERVYRVSPLSSPDRGESQGLASVGQYDAVNLFVARSPNLTLTTDSAAAVAELCALLGGLPLVVELAAARTKDLPPFVILRELEETFGQPSNSSEPAPPRETVRVTVAWSYGHLSAAEQELFRRLAVFRGGCTPEAAIAVCDGTRSSIAKLVESRLVRQDSTRGDIRLSMHEAVRQWALEQLEAVGDAAFVGERHAEYFLALARADGDEPFGADEVSGLKRLEREHANVRAALEWSREPGRAEHELRLAIALARFWKVRGHFHEGRRWLGEALARSADLPCALRADALGWASILALHQGATQEAKRLSTQRLALCRDADHGQGIAHSLLTLGNVAMAEGHVQQARALYSESRELSLKLSDATNFAAATMNLGYAALTERRFDRARVLCEDALALFRDAKDTEGIALGLQNLGALALLQEDRARAVELLSESLELSQELSHKELLVWCLEALAALLTAQEDHARAIRVLGSAEALRESTGAALQPAERELHRRTLVTLRGQFNEQTFATHWFAGRALAPEEALPYAVETAAATVTA